MIATRNGLSRSLHVGIYVIMSFLYTLLFLYVVCCQNKSILILILIPNDKAPGIDETPIELWKSSEKRGSPCCGSCVIRYGGAKSGPRTGAEEFHAHL